MVVDPVSSVMDCIAHYVDALVDLRVAAMEERGHKVVLVERSRANLELALRQILPRRSTSVSSMRIVLEHDPDDEDKK